jgi:uncharacterized protein (TIGR03067 family)
VRTRRFAGLLAAVLLCSQAASSAQGQAEKDRQALPGDWRTISQLPESMPNIRLDRLVIRGETMTFHYRLENRRSSVTANFTLNPNSDPRHITFEPAGGGNVNKAYRGLYALKGGRLHLCYRGPGASRPKSFADKGVGNESTVFLALKKGDGK